MRATSDHWDDVWRQGQPDRMSWFQASSEPCLSMLRRVTAPGSEVVVMGAGTSPLVASLLAERRVVLAVDISETALRRLRDDTGDDPALTTVTADARSFVPQVAVDAWHDRAVFHFLVDERDRDAYIGCVTQGVRQGGHLLVATFAPDGPSSCSGLPVRRYDAAELAEVFSSGFELVESSTVDHHTPWDAVQPFTHVLLRRR